MHQGLDEELHAQGLRLFDLLDVVVMHLNDVHANLVDPTGELQDLLEAHRYARDLTSLAQRHVHEGDLRGKVHVAAYTLVEVVRADCPHPLSEAGRVLPSVGHVSALLSFGIRPGEGFHVR